jgi:two-component system, chemotaxis family, chemotaxis protein CheY
MNILLVDDSRIMRSILKNVIREKMMIDTVFYEAPNGKIAFDIMDETTIDLLLVDWNMPELNGLELVKILRNMEQYRRLPILMVTAESAKYNVMEAIREGVTDYMVKPVTGPMILKKIQSYIK